jgi:phage-related protein
VAALDEFLDSHPDVDQTLGKNPWLIRNAQYLKEHPELQTFLNQHPELKEESAETPKYLMQREQRFDAREQARDRDRDVNRDRDFDRNRDADAQRDRDIDRDRDQNTTRNTNRDVDRRTNPNPDLTHQEVASMDDFLDRHGDIAKSLEKKPELINDQSYLKRHKDLSEFLSEHPAVREEARENPS